MFCPHCGNKIPENHHVTCGDSYCSEANYYDWLRLIGPKKKRAIHDEQYRCIVKIIEANKQREKGF